eukprot:786097-Heterocapsa_arctica.AAC.1
MCERLRAHMCVGARIHQDHELVTEFLLHVVHLVDLLLRDPLVEFGDLHFMPSIFLLHVAEHRGSNVLASLDRHLDANTVRTVVTHRTKGIGSSSSGRSRPPRLPSGAMAQQRAAP